MILALVLGVAALAAAPAPGAAKATWQAAFPSAGGHRRVSLTAVLEDRQGQQHQLRLWREGGHLRRDTEQTRIFGERGAAGESYLVEQRSAGRAYHVSQANLHRLGMFTGWDALASLLAQPRGEPRVSLLAGAPARTAFGPCRRWEVEGAGLRVCWSDALGLPLEVEEKRGEQWKQTLRIERLETGPIAKATWSVPRGLRIIDLDAELERGGD